VSQQPKVNAKPQPATAEQASLERLRQVLIAAMRGDPSAAGVIETLFNGPAGPPLVEQLGNVGVKAQQAWVDVCSDRNPLVGEALRRKLDQLRRELEGPEPTPLERLLVERVLLCWLQVHQADVWGAANAGPAESAQRAQGHAQARYLAALRSLVTVRKLLRPPLSPLDLAARPVNEGTPADPASRRRGTAVGGAPVEN